MSAGFPQAKVDEVMSTIESLPEPLVQAYYDMMREDVHLRLSKDEDYKEKRGDGRSPYEFLDKL